MELYHFLVVEINDMVVFGRVSVHLIFRRHMILQVWQEERLDDFLNFELFSSILKKLLKDIHFGIEVPPEIPQVSIGLFEHKVKQLNTLDSQALEPALHVRPHHQDERD